MEARLLIGRASWTLVDQGVVSGGNFLLNVLLARSLSAADYGQFVLFLGAIIALRAFDYSLISYPLSVRLCVARDEERAGLLGNTILLAVALNIVSVVAMGLGATLLNAHDAWLPACLCFSCWQAKETSRRCLLADFHYRAAVPGDGTSHIGQALLIALLAWMGAVSLSGALYAMSATFAIGAVVHVSKLRLAWPDLRQTRRLARDYFAIGKWSLVNYQLTVLRGQMFPWMLAGTVGTAATASYQAGANISGTMNPIIMGIGNAIPQVAAQARATGGVIGALRAAYGYVLFGLAPVLVMCTAAVLVPEFLLRTVYGPSSPYVAAAMPLQFLAIAGALDYIADAATKTLLGVQAGKLASLVNAAGVATAAILAFAVVGRLGVVGATLGLLIANLVRATGAVLAILWLIAREKSSIPGPSVTDVAPASSHGGDQ